MYPQSIQNLIRAFKKFPSVGERTAERYIFHLLKSGKKETTELMLALKELVEKVKSCEVCWNFSDQSPCPICRDPKRQNNLVCVVADPPNVKVIEKTGVFQGRYHVLRGTIDGNNEEIMKELKIKELLERIKTSTPPIQEIILALNPDLAGETTMLYLTQEIEHQNPKIKISRLARGLPLGADVRYADEITLASAIKNRTEK